MAYRTEDARFRADSTERPDRLDSSAWDEPNRWRAALI